MGASRLTEPVVGMNDDPQTGGYWLVASDGGVFAFDAPFYGSAGANPLKYPVIGIGTTMDGNRYLLAASDSTTDAFTTTTNPASLPDLGVNLAALRATGTWWHTAFNEFSAAGSSWVRVDVPWPDLEPSQGSFSEPLLASMDSVVSTASSMGMSVLFVVLGTPFGTNLKTNREPSSSKTLREGIYPLRPIPLMRRRWRYWRNDTRGEQSPGRFGMSPTTQRSSRQPTPRPIQVLRAPHIAQSKLWHPPPPSLLASSRARTQLGSRKHMQQGFMDASTSSHFIRTTGFHRLNPWTGNLLSTSRRTVSS